MLFIQDCTFIPHTNPTSAMTQSKDPVIVRGLGRYLELKEMAKRREDELREREEKVFHSNVSRPARHSFTIPKPFHLESDKKAKERRRRIEAEIEAERAKECTFKPRTSQAMTRNAIRKLLEED